MIEYILGKNKEGLKKLILGFTVLDIIIIIIVGAFINTYLANRVIWVGNPIYYNKNNVINSFFNEEYFRQSVYEQHVKATATEVAKSTRGFSYFSTKEFIKQKESVDKNRDFRNSEGIGSNEFYSMISSNYGMQVGFAYINKNTGDIISNEFRIIDNVVWKDNISQIENDIEELFPNEYVTVYDNDTTEGVYAEAAILSDENKNYIEIYFKSKDYYNEILKQFRSIVIKVAIMYFFIFIILIKGIIFFVRHGIKGGINYNKEVFNIIIRGNLMNSFYLGATGGVREKNYLAFLLISTVGNLVLFIYYLDRSYIQSNIVFCILLEIVIVLIYRDKIYYFKTLRELDNINEDNLHYAIDDKSPYYISSIIKEINLISKGYSKAIDERMKNDRLKTELISNVSHDLKTPLTSIINYIQILKREDITEKEREEFLKIVATKSRRLKSLIDDLFEAVKLEEDSIGLDLHVIDILELLNQVVGEYADNIEEKGLKLKITSKDKEYKLYLDGNKMSRVFANIVSNICKYSKENTEVNISVYRENNKIKLSFENYSCYEMHFDEEEIFERFARGDKSRNSKIEGSGLGLAISKNIVQMHGGNMKIKRIDNKFNVIINL